MYKFTDNLIITVHDMLLNNIDERKGYRTHDIRVFRSKFDASPVEYVKTDMNVLMKLLDKQKRKLHPLVFACIFHHKMEKIHPFSDGNGRTGRVLLNYWLLKEGYPPLIISKNKRNKYLDMLNFADKSDLTDVDRKYYSKLSNYVAEELIESYWKIFNV
jgi:Fic family protein